MHITLGTLLRPASSTRRTLSVLETLYCRRTTYHPLPRNTARFSTFISMSSEKKTNGGITGWASKEDGAFKRQVSSFRDHIEPGGRFKPEKGRYHLYVSLACPWAHRALIVRNLKGLQDYMGESASSACIL